MGHCGTFSLCNACIEQTIRVEFVSAYLSFSKRLHQGDFQGKGSMVLGRWCEMSLETWMVGIFTLEMWAGGDFSS